MSRPHRVRLAALAAPLLVLALTAFGAGGAALRSPQLLDAVLTLVSRRFVDSLPAESIYVRAARGLLAEVRDPYAALYSPEDLAYFRRQTIGDSYGGVGMEVTNDSGGVRVTRVFEGTPSARMGVQVGDHLLEVDGVDVRRMTIDQVSPRLMGRPGSEVRLTLERFGAPAPIRVAGRRAAVNVPAVPVAAVVDGDVGYVPLQHFSSTASSEVAEAMRRLRRQGATRFVLDLRSNGGGDLNAAIAVSELFLAPGAHVVTVRSRGVRDEVHDADERPAAPVDTVAPLVVMVDDGTASASEIVAGALQDHDRALVVGTTSYGKGLVQTLYPLEGGWALKLTTGKWYTPSGRLIQRERKIDDGGRLVEVRPDSLETDSVRRSRPAFRSDHGRLVYGGGGITPDVIVPAESLTTAERELVRALAPSSTIVSGIVERYALELRARGERPERSPARRDELHARLQRAGVRVPRPVFDAGGRLVDRWIDRRLVTLSEGDSAWVRRSAHDDPQLARALAMLRVAPTTNALIASGAVRH